MKKGFWICILVLAAVLAIVFWHRPAQLPTNTQVSTQGATGQLTNLPPKNTSVAGSGVSNPLAAMASSARPQSSVANNLRTPSGFQQYIEGKNSPIEFFGQVIDQSSNPISGAKIDIGIRHWYVPDLAVLNEEGKTIHLDAVSDAAGRFEINGATGDGFGVGITKDGYELEPNRYGFGPAAGSYYDPVIFKMWNTNVHVQLITGDKPFDIVPDGRPYFIDLTTDTINESGNGDLRIWIQYTNQIVRGQLYGWSAGIEVPDGGLLEVGSGSAMYEAPADGYIPAFQLRGQIKGGQRGQINERQFYLRLKNGQEYGQMSIDLIAPFNSQTPGLVRLSYAINPSGSRILR